MAILGNFWTTMKQKQSMVIFVNYKDNYDTTTTTANKSMGFDLSAIQSCLGLMLLNSVIYILYHWYKLCSVGVILCISTTLLGGNQLEYESVQHYT